MSELIEAILTSNFRGVSSADATISAVDALNETELTVRIQRSGDVSQ